MKYPHSVKIIVRKVKKPTFCSEEDRNLFQTLGGRTNSHTSHHSVTSEVSRLLTILGEKHFEKHELFDNPKRMTTFKISSIIKTVHYVFLFIGCVYVDND